MNTWIVCPWPPDRPLDALLAAAADAAHGPCSPLPAPAFGELKGEAGAVSAETVLAEVDKRRRPHALSLPEELCGETPPTKQLSENLIVVVF